MTVWAALSVGGCASQPDHFYTLNTVSSGVQPAGANPVPTTPTVHALLDVSVPAAVDRAEMVVNTSDLGILVLDHERWLVPFSVQLAQTLGLDIQLKRPDILVGDHAFDQPLLAPVLLKVAIVKMTAQRGGRVTLDAQWRIVDAAAHQDQIGIGTFTAPIDGAGYASIAQAYSQVVAALADKLAATLAR